MTADRLQLVEQALKLIAPFVLLYVVVMLALRYQAVGMLLALAGVGGIVWGSWYLMGALSPENRSNDLKDIAVAFGIAAILSGGLLMVTGVWTTSPNGQRVFSRTRRLGVASTTVKSPSMACLSRT